MYPTLTHFFEDIFGINIPLPIQSFGFFVAIAFIIGAYLVGREFYRKEQQGLLSGYKVTVLEGQGMSTKDWVVSGVMGFILSYKLGLILTDYAFFAKNPQDTLLSMEGNFLTGVIGTGVYLIYRYLQDKKAKLETPLEKELTVLPHQVVGDVTITVAIFSLLGAKVFHFLEYPETFVLIFSDPAGSLFSGLTFYGGLLFGMSTTFYYAKKFNTHVLHLFDAVSPTLMLAYGIGRMGCHVAGDGDWGIDNLAVKPSWLSIFPDWIWAYNYPHNVNGEGVPIPGCVGDFCYQLANPVFPTPLYEILMCSVLFAILWAIRKKVSNVPGILFSIYLVFNGFERYLIEQIRVNVKYDFGWWQPTQAEMISLGIILAGVIGIILCYKAKDRWNFQTK